SADGHVLVFNGADPRIVNLAAGQVVVLEDMGARKVLGVLRQGPLTAIATNSAGLTDFIQDGTIQFPNASKDPIIRNQQDTDEYGLKGEMNNWDFDVHSELDNNDLEFSFDTKKILSGLTARVKGSGKLTESGFSFLADIHGGRLQKLVY